MGDSDSAIGSMEYDIPHSRNVFLSRTFVLIFDQGLRRSHSGIASMNTWKRMGGDFINTSKEVSTLLGFKIAFHRQLT
jgi:hypothetical protein